MANGVDPNELLLTGENSFIRLSEENDEPTTHVSHWRVLISKGGPGHVAFVKSELTGNEPRIYSDNIALARWLQEGIQGSVTEVYSDPGIPVIESLFTRSGDATYFWTETIESGEDDVALTWFDFWRAVCHQVRARRQTREALRDLQHTGPGPTCGRSPSTAWRPGAAPSPQSRKGRRPAPAAWRSPSPGCCHAAASPPPPTGSPRTHRRRPGRLAM